MRREDRATSREEALLTASGKRHIIPFQGLTSRKE